MAASDEDSILLHPDALHCLKRKQLVSLCRRLDIKANGKSADLIARLQAFAGANIAPNSPTRGNLALLRHVKRPRPSYHEAGSDDDRDDHPPPDAAGEMICADSTLPQPAQSLRRSPRKGNVSSVPTHSTCYQTTQPLRQSTKRPRALLQDAAASGSKHQHRPTSAQAQVADLSLDIDRMLRDIHSPEPADVDIQDISMVEEQGASPEHGAQAAIDAVQPLEPFMTEFGSMAAMDIHADASRPPSASLESKSSSSSSSPWKVLGGSLKGLKNGLQRMGSLSKGRPKKAAGGKRPREDADVGHKDQDAEAQLDGAEMAGDQSMPGSFDGSMLFGAQDSMAEAAQIENRPSPPSQSQGQANVLDQAQTEPLRIIKPRSSRSRASLGPAMLLSASPSRLYPDLAKLGASLTSPAERRPAPPPLPSMPSISNQQFQTATESILADLNARLAAKGVSTTSLSTLGGGGQWGDSTTSLRDLGLNKGKGGRFDSDHEKQFGQMDSIANHYAAKRSRPNDASPNKALSSSVNGRVSDRPQSVRPMSRMATGASSSSLAAAGTQRGGAGGMSTAVSSKRIRVSEDPNRPGLSTSASARSVAPPGMKRSTTATSLTSVAQRELQRKRLELARQRRLSKGGGAVGTSAASGMASAKAKDRGRLERIKMGIKGMLNSASGSSSASTSQAATGAAAKAERPTEAKKVNDGSIGSTKSAVSAASAALSSSSSSSAKAPSSLVKRKAVFDLKASLSRKPSTSRPTSAAGCIDSSKPAAAAAVANRLRTQGWTGSSSTSSRPATSTGQHPSTAREFGSVRTNATTSVAPAAGTATCATKGLTSSASTTSLGTKGGQKKTLLKVGKPVTGGVKRPRIQPDRLLQRKKEAIAQAAVRTTMLASSSSMDIARKMAAAAAAAATTDEASRRGVTFPSSASAAGFTRQIIGSNAHGPSNKLTQPSTAAAVAGATTTVSHKISSRTPSNVSLSNVHGATSKGPTQSLAETMRAARLAELKARNRATEAGIGLGRTSPLPVKPPPATASSSLTSSTISGGITAQNRYTLLRNSPTKPPPTGGRGEGRGPTLTPRSS